MEQYALVRLLFQSTKALGLPDASCSGEIHLVERHGPRKALRDLLRDQHNFIGVGGVSVERFWGMRLLHLEINLNGYNENRGFRMRIECHGAVKCYRLSS